MSGGDTRPEYDIATVEAVMLEVAADLHPRRLTARGLLGEIVVDPDDDREIETARRAIANLRELGLFREQADGVVEPTPSGLRAVALLT